MSYRVKEVVDLTGIPRNTLLAWERRYDVVEPDRLDNGYRVYRDEHVARLLEIKRLIAQGHKVSEAIDMLDRLEAAQAGPGSQEPLERLRDELYTALLASNGDRAEAVAASLAEHDRDEVIDRVYFPILARVGEGWACGQVSIAQEHTATAFIRARLLATLEERRRQGPGLGRVLCARYPGEHHDVPLLALAVQLSQRGYAVQMLEEETTTEGICATVRRDRPDMVCVSVMRAHRTPALVAFALELMRAAPRECRLVVGGRGLPRPVPQAPSRVAWLRSAEGLLRQLDGLPEESERASA